MCGADIAAPLPDEDTSLYIGSAKHRRPARRADITWKRTERMKFRDLTPGRVIVGGRHTVTQDEIVEFARRYDPQWFHTDPDRARSSRWDGLIASGWMTCGIAMQLAVTAVLAASESIGSPGVEQIKWPAPVRPGDELELRIEVLESRVSRSGSIGIVRWRWWLTSGTGITVLDLVATSLFELATPAGAAS